MNLNSIRIFSSIDDYVNVIVTIWFIAAGAYENIVFLMPCINLRMIRDSCIVEKHLSH